MVDNQIIVSLFNRFMIRPVSSITDLASRRSLDAGSDRYLHADTGIPFLPVKTGGYAMATPAGVEDCSKDWLSFFSLSYCRMIKLSNRLLSPSSQTLVSPSGTAPGSRPGSCKASPIQRSFCTRQFPAANPKTCREASSQGP